MTTDLEIIDYDLEGAAYDGTGSVVDGAFLLARQPTTGTRSTP
jgi:hypothetical protein